MNRAVVVATWSGGQEPAEVLLKSLIGCVYPVYVVVNSAKNADPAWLDSLAWVYHVRLIEEDRFELGAISVILESTDIDEFVLLQDTFEVKDQAFLDVCFAEDASIALGPNFFHYAGKFRRRALEKMTIPVVTTKAESIFHEHDFVREYAQHDLVRVFDPHFHDGENQGFVEAFGRMNMLLENAYFIKRKGTWA